MESGIEEILVGCEKICIGEQNTDLIACPLLKKEGRECKEYRQYEAGRSEIVNKLITIINNKPRDFESKLQLIIQIIEDIHKEQE